MPRLKKRVIVRHPWEWVEGRGPSEGGIYAIYMRGKIIYIGATQNVKTRMRDHKKWIGSRRYRLKVSLNNDRWDRIVRETRLIKRIEPPHNKKLARQVKMAPLSLYVPRRIVTYANALAAKRGMKLSRTVAQLIERSWRQQQRETASNG